MSTKEKTNKKLLQTVTDLLLTVSFCSQNSHCYIFSESLPSHQTHLFLEIQQ